MPRSPVDEGINAELSIQPSTSQDEANLQYNIGCRRHRSPDDGGGYSPVEDGVIEYGEGSEGDELKPAAGLPL